MEIKKVFDFLKLIKKNNSREWFNSNKTLYDAARQEVIQLTQAVQTHFADIDPEIVRQKPTDCIFRLYRDVRFSKNKEPYKTHFGIVLAPGGRKSSLGGYYIHLEPDNTFCGGGVWHPEPKRLKAIRQEIDYNLEEFKSIVRNNTFIDYFGDIRGEKLKTTPKNYTTDNPAIEYLRFKDFTALHNIDATWLANNPTEGVLLIIDAFKKLMPLNAFLNRAQEDV